MLVLEIICSPALAQFPDKSSEWNHVGEQADTGLGTSIAGAGDVDHDGFNDLLVGLPYYRTTNGTTVGKILLFRGSRLGLRSSPDWAYLGDAPNAQLGARVAGGKDLNHDGFADIVVGANLYHGRFANEGRVLVFYGSPSGPGPQPDWSFSGGESYQLLGIPAGLGDFNGDGVADLVVFCRDQPANSFYFGRLLVFFGNKSGLPSSPSQSILGPPLPEASFGESMVPVGDVNHDGFDDLLVGAPHYRGREIAQGRVFLFYGSPSGLQTNAAWEHTYDPGEWPGMKAAQNQIYGQSLGAAGDINGDGYADLLVGTLAGSHGESTEGLAFAFNGSASTPTNSPDWFIEGNQIQGALGSALDGVGDVNGDGIGDVLVGARNMTHRVSHEGVAALYYGSRDGLSHAPSWTASGSSPGAEFGAAVAWLGDANGDGFSDFAVGAPGFRVDSQRRGRIEVFYGSRVGPRESSGWSPIKSVGEQVRDSTNLAVARLGWRLLLLSVTAFIGAIWGTRHFLRLRMQRKLELIDPQSVIAAERSRLARDLHDDVGARLTRLSNLLSQVAQLKDAERASKPDPRLQELLNETRELAEAMDHVIWAVKPQNDTLEALIDLLDVYADRVLRGAGIRCETDFPEAIPNIPLPAKVRQNLGLALSEILTNVVKHSRATKVWLQLRWNEPELQIVVRDDGRGFDAKGPAQRDQGTRVSQGNGLPNLRFRLSEIHAHTNIESQPGKGACFTIRLELEEQ